MSASNRILDTRGLACPEPVVLTRKALAEGGFEQLEVLVDDASSLENVVRFAGYARCAVETREGAGGATHVLIRPGTAAPAAAGATPDAFGTTPDAFGVGPESQPLPAGDSAALAGGATVFIAAAGIGAGDEALGALLMRGFIYALAEGEAAPLQVILMNGGVRLAVEGSESLENLRRLAGRGVEILACGTCLEYFQLKDQLAVGRVSNMYEIAERLQQGRVVRI
jgi:selenium metabolism protein YedF